MRATANGRRIASYLAFVVTMLGSAPAAAQSPYDGAAEALRAVGRYLSLGFLCIVIVGFIAGAVLTYLVHRREVSVRNVLAKFMLNTSNRGNRK